MGKRKREHSNNDVMDIFKRFKAFEKEISQKIAQRRQRDPTPPPTPRTRSPPPPPRSRSSSSSSSSRSSRSSSTSSSCSNSSGCSQSARSCSPRGRETADISALQESSYNEDVPSNAADDPKPSTSAASAAVPPPLPPPELMLPQTSETQPLPVATESSAAASQLDEELMKIFGDDPSKQKVTGKDIQPDLAVRLQHIATSGLNKEVRKELLDKYLLPGNCTLIDSPDLNPEVKAAISDAIYKRDKGIKIRQKQLASATSCLAEALTLLLASEPRNMEVIKLLMDASKLLCDNQHQDSVTRRNFVLYNLKKELKDQLQATKIDKYLFSQDLADTLKAAKAISKSGADMKPSSSNQNQQPAKNVKQPQKNLNWRAPHPNHKPKGTMKTKEAAARKSRQENSYKQSLRPVPAPAPASSHSRRR